MIDDDRYLEVHAEGDVRVKGTRVGVEHLLSAYLAGSLPEEIAAQFPTVTLEQVHGVIAWYLRNRREVEEYLARWQESAREARRRQANADRVEVVERLRRLAETR